MELFRKKLSKIRAVIFIIAILLSSGFFSASNVYSSTTVTARKEGQWFIGQETTVLNTGVYNNSTNGWGFTVNIPETPTVRSAIIEVTGVSYNSSGSQTITVDLERGIDSKGVCTAPAYGCVQTYTLAVASQPQKFKVLYDALLLNQNIPYSREAPIANIVSSNTNYSYTLYVKGDATGGKFSLFAAKLILSYDASSEVSSQLKGQEYFVHQELASSTNGTEVSKAFTVTIPEDTPQIKSVFIEVTGVASGNSTVATIGDDLTTAGGPTYLNTTLDLGGFGSTIQFRRLLDVSSVVKDSDFPGSKSYTFYYKGANFDTNVVSAKLYVTYSYHGTTGNNYRISGTITSSVYDTGVTLGASYNSIYWLGTLGSPAGVVKLQMATSNCQNGKANPPACTINGPLGQTWVYRGPDCTANTYYQINPNTPTEIGCNASHENNHYVRYKIILCSNDCVTGGTSTPQVDDVIINISK